MPEAPHVFHWNDVPWDDPTAGTDPKLRPPKELVEAARASGARRKKVVRGEAGFYMNRSQLSAGFRVPPHRHDHNELMVVLDGGCSFDDGLAELGVGDSIVIHAGTLYGFTSGDSGMEFLTIRMGDATIAVE